MTILETTECDKLEQQPCDIPDLLRYWLSQQQFRGDIFLTNTSEEPGLSPWSRDQFIQP